MKPSEEIEADIAAACAKRMELTGTGLPTWEELWDALVVEADNEVGTGETEELWGDGWRIHLDHPADHGR